MRTANRSREQPPTTCRGSVRKRKNKQNNTLSTPSPRCPHCSPRFCAFLHYLVLHAMHSVCMSLCVQNGKWEGRGADSNVRLVGLQGPGHRCVYTLFRGAHRCRPQTAQKNNNAFCMCVVCIGNATLGAVMSCVPAATAAAYLTITLGSAPHVLCRMLSCEL
jgi:hypothetical protein